MKISYQKINLTVEEIYYMLKDTKGNNYVQLKRVVR